MIELINIAIHIIVQLKWDLLIKSQTHILTQVKKLMKKDSKFKIGDTVRIAKYRNNLAKCYL